MWGVLNVNAPAIKFYERGGTDYMKEQKLYLIQQRIGKDNIYRQCKAVGKCQKAFEYGVSRHLQSTRFWAISLADKSFEFRKLHKKSS